MEEPLFFSNLKESEPVPTGNTGTAPRPSNPKPLSLSLSAIPISSRTPERLAQLNPLPSLLAPSAQTLMLLLLYRQPPPCLTIQLCLLISPPFHPFPTPNSSLSLPCSTMPEGFKAWAPWNSGTTHLGQGDPDPLAYLQWEPGEGGGG